MWACFPLCLMSREHGLPLCSCWSRNTHSSFHRLAAVPRRFCSGSRGAGTRGTTLNHTSGKGVGDELEETVKKQNMSIVMMEETVTNIVVLMTGDTVTNIVVLMTGNTVNNIVVLMTGDTVNNIVVMMTGDSHQHCSFDDRGHSQHHCSFDDEETQSHTMYL